MTSLTSALPTVQPGSLHIIASDFDARPMSHVDASGRQGYEPELTRLICQYLELEPVWHNCPMAEFYTKAQTGNYDVVWFNQAITPERQDWVDFTQPYGLFDEAVLVRANSHVSAPADLDGLCVGGLADSTNIALAANWPGVTTKPYPGSDKVLPEMLAALRAGEIDALIDDELVLVVAAEEDSTLRLAFSVPTQVPFGIGVTKQRPELLAALNNALTQFKEDGRMAAIWSEWIPWKRFPFV
jgi:ABC-type amino acid transport substrate-binding protein